MTNEDSLIVHKLAKTIEDRGKEIQLLVEQEGPTDDGLFDRDLMKKVLDIKWAHDRIDTLMAYYQIHK